MVPETMIVTALRASCRGHHSITINPTGQATGRMAIAGGGQLKWRELAHMSAEGHVTQHTNFSWRKRTSTPVAAMRRSDRLRCGS